MVDFLFWVAVALLIALLAGGVYFLSRRRGGTASVDWSKAIWAAVDLAVIVLAGFTAVPAFLTQGGAIVTSGSSFGFNSYDYYLNVPITSTRSSSLVGSFESNIPVDVYLLNTSIWDNNFGPYCP